jgi:hypothetical protein
MHDLIKGYVFPNGQIFNSTDHADAWDDIPNNMDIRQAMKYTKSGNELILQGKLTRPVMDAFVKYGVDPTNIRYGSIDDEMIELNKKTIIDKINKLGWVGIGGGYQAIPKIIRGETYFTHIKTPEGEIYKDKYGAGIDANTIKIYGGISNVIANDSFYIKISPEDFIKSETYYLNIGMRKSDQVRLGDIYGEMLRSVKVVSESTIKKGGNDLSDKNPNPLSDGGPKEEGGYFKALNDAYRGDKKNCCGKINCGCIDRDEDNEEEKDNDEKNSRVNRHPINKKTKKLENALRNPNLSERAKKQIERQIALTAGIEDEENIQESKKIAKNVLNRIMTRKKSTFDKLFESVIKENFGMEENNEDLDALGLDDAASDDELGDDFDLGGEEDSVTFTLDRATAQTLIDVLQGALGEGEGDDLDFDDEGDDMDFGDEGDDMGDESEEYGDEEDEETIGAKDAKGGGQQHPLQGRNNKVNGRPQPKGGSAQHGVTDKVGNDGDYGHAGHGARKPNDGRQNKVGNLKPGADLF